MVPYPFFKIYVHEVPSAYHYKFQITYESS